MGRQTEHKRTDEALDSLAAAGDGPVVLLHSGRHHPIWATRSLLARPAAWFRYTADRRSELATVRGLPVPGFVGTNHLWRDLRTLLSDSRFPGRWFGYISYDVGRLIEPGKLAPRVGNWPLVELAWCPQVQVLEPCGVGRDALPNLKVDVSGLQSNFTRSGYESAVRCVLEYIGAGDVFQVNLAQRLTGSFTGEPRELFAKLAGISPAWYGAHLELPGDRAILSTSPELFLKFEGRRVLTRPIKGTLPASRSAEELRLSAKDAAELNMIVDLMRNDLGRVCSYGSVRVTEPRTIETHPTVHHGVATVEGELHPTMDAVDLLKATLPAGSVTGAPKVRAMQVIDELEPDPRGAYCGAIGYISKDELQLSVAIRTMLLTRIDPVDRRWRVDFSVGGGVVADSDASLEYEETLVKARAMVAALDG